MKSVRFLLGTALTPDPVVSVISDPPSQVAFQFGPSVCTHMIIGVASFFPVTFTFKVCIGAGPCGVTTASGGYPYLKNPIA
ncbi:hypothetical protein D3C76_1610570 [compost metagenome]